MVFRPSSRLNEEGDLVAQARDQAHQVLLAQERRRQRDLAAQKRRAERDMHAGREQATRRNLEVNSRKDLAEHEAEDDRIKISKERLGRNWDQEQKKEMEKVQDMTLEPLSPRTFGPPTDSNDNLSRRPPSMHKHHHFRDVQESSMAHQWSTEMGKQTARDRAPTEHTPAPQPRMSNLMSLLNDTESEEPRRRKVSGQKVSGHIPDLLPQHNVPKFERTYTDIAADNFYDPSAVKQPVQQTKPIQSSLLSPDRSRTRGSTTYRVNDDKNDYWVDVFVNDKLVQAFPDNGSSLNLVSEAYVLQEGLAVSDSTTQTILLPNNKRAQSLGALTVFLKFFKEEEALSVTFTILRNCVHNFILSDTFLRTTQMFTRHWSRIQRLPFSVSAPRRVCFNGVPRQRVVGSINGHLVDASADTGSNVNVIRRELATRLNLDISNDVQDVILQLVDGTYVLPLGVIRNAVWRYGKAVPAHIDTATIPAISNEASWRACEFGTNASHGSTFVCDFYLLEDLPVPVILSSSLLYGTNDFTNRVQWTDNMVNSEHFLHSAAPIKRILPFKGMLRSGKRKSATVPLSPDDEELERYEKSMNAIALTPAPLRAAPLAAEQRNQQQYRNLRPPQPGASSQPAPGNHTSTPMLQSPAATTLPPPSSPPAQTTATGFPGLMVSNPPAMNASPPLVTNSATSTTAPAASPSHAPNYPSP